MRSSSQIRQEFIDFFKSKQHAFAPSSPVVPHDDPTLLFTNAGMNQFKDVFLGTGSRPYTRAANTQKCIRAGGKHNDLDDVGQDTYHHTFFEMLGNWSFGDYFKVEAIEWAWELLTQVWGIDGNRLHATYFEGDPAEGLEPDSEARELWLKLLPPERVHPGNKKDNFWEMGDTGPCGPCSEIHIDLTPDKSGGHLVNAGDARVIEIWNLVFIQFNRGPDGKLSPLPAKHVDTGMGFERVSAVLQHKTSNYDTDVFTPLFDAIQKLSGAQPYGGKLPGDEQRGASRDDVMRDTTYRVIADHIRCLNFALTDGAVPDKDGRGYVLRRILRRGVRYGWQYFGLREPFLHRLVPAVVDLMGDAFPELRQNTASVIELIRDEEESFGRTLDRGIALFDEAADTATRQHHGEIQGADAFKLHDTYGFPIDLTQIMADEKGLRVDIGEYERLMEEARDRARAGGSAAASELAHLPGEHVTRFGATDDTPKYDAETLDGAKVLGVVRFADGAAQVLAEADSLQAGDRGALVLDKTCFYGEQGGQVGDAGVIRSSHNVQFDVGDTQRIGDTIVHVGAVAAGAFRANDPVTLEVHARRAAVKQNHTATHVLNWALRDVLGDHIQQKGSLVDDEKTRFDFSHPKALTADEAARIEQRVNEQIRQKLPVDYGSVPQDEALKINGLRAVFGEKYPDVVRVVSVGAAVNDLRANPDNPEWRQYSIEFCGGTHLRNTADIEHFALLAEEAVAKGVRRLVGVTGERAADAERTGRALLERAEKLQSADGEPLASGVATLAQELTDANITLTQRHALRDQLAELQKKAKAAQKQQAAAAAGAAVDQVRGLIKAAPRVGDTTLLFAQLDASDVEQLKTAADAVKQKCGSAVVLLAADGDGKALLLAAATDDVIKRGVKAGDLVKEAAKQVKGGGGGPPTMAQAGGKDPSQIPAALQAGEAWVRAKLG